MALTLAAPTRAGRSVERAIEHDGLKRLYLVHVPPGPHKDGRPIVLALHGGGGSSEAMERSYGLDEYADRYDMIVVYPAGIGSPIGNFHTWNAGNCCGAAHRKNIDDVGFLSAVIDAVAREERADARRVFVTGHSNGAQMTYRLACEIPEKLAAIAPVAGQNVSPSCARPRRLPVLHVHGTLDRCALYDGGDCGGCFATALGLPGIESKWACDPVPDQLAALAKAYGCSPRTEPAKRAGPVQCDRWLGCPADASIEFCRIVGGGHVWQGSTDIPACRRRPDGPLCRRWHEQAGPILQGVDTNALVFDFFSKH